MERIIIEDDSATVIDRNKEEIKHLEIPSESPRYPKFLLSSYYGICSIYLPREMNIIVD